MKTLNKIHQLLVLLYTACGIFLLQSCVIYKQSEPAVKVPDILQMSKEGVSSKDIIQKMKSSHTVYTLKAVELSKLQKLGVPDSVINYMEETHLDAIRQDAQNDNFYNWGPGWGGYYFGYPYYGWSYPYYGGYWGPSIIYRGGGHYEGHGGGGRR